VLALYAASWAKTGPGTDALQPLQLGRRKVPPPVRLQQPEDLFDMIDVEPNDCLFIPLSMEHEGEAAELGSNAWVRAHGLQDLAAPRIDKSILTPQFHQPGPVLLGPLGFGYPVGFPTDSVLLAEAFL
jgi:hypothetical protein